jgi:hypothetical protein
VVLEPLAEEGYRLIVSHPDLEAELNWLGGQRLDIRVRKLDSEILQPLVASLLDVSAVGGAMAGQATIDEQGFQLDLVLEDLFFDSKAGYFAGAGLDLEVGVNHSSDQTGYVLNMSQSAGELLLGPVYLPPPVAPVTLRTELGLTESGSWTARDLSFSDPGALSMKAELSVRSEGDTWTLESVRLDSLDADLAGLWKRWLDGPAAAAGFPELEASGLVSGSLEWAAGGKARIDFEGVDIDLNDPMGRFGLKGFAVAVQGSNRASQLEMSWQGLQLMGLTLAPSAAEFHYDEVGWRLLNPVHMGLLDGALVIEGLAWLQIEELESKLVMDVRIDPLDLAALTGELGLPELGGRLAGRFPGVTYSDGRLAFTGGIDVNAFSGRIGVADLVVERLFGSTPALSAQVDMDRLDLLELTGAFGFGRMEGQASGYVHGLRLLDWRPVAMDARLYTHDDAPVRRISQRAVDNLSSLGGGGSALISGTVLRVFEDFPYARAGLACRLENNICRIDGVAPHESGGFLIVEGRGLPRLDVVGHRRLVDWPRLTSQLAAMMASGSAEPGENHGGSGP